MAKTPKDGGETISDNIISEHIDDALSSRYLAYALSTITLSMMLSSNSLKAFRLDIRWWTDRGTSEILTAIALRLCAILKQR